MLDPISIIHKFPGLKVVFPKFLEKNTSNQAPYHNLWHTLCMVKFCFQAGIYEELNESDKSDLLIAALIHDLCHSEGKTSDSENVQRAIDSGYDLYEDTGIFLGRDDYNERIARIIKATEYPYVISANKLDKQQAIIRDADLMQSFEDTWFTHTTMGLSIELGVDLKEFIPMQIDFMLNMEFNTNWGRVMSKGKIEVQLERLGVLNRILNE